MKTYWFSILSAAGIVLLTSSVFGNELQWKKPGSNSAQSAVIRIPTVITTDDGAVPSAVVQVQAVMPIDPPPRPPQASPAQLDRDFPELRPQSKPVPPGATIQNVPTQSIPTLPSYDLPIPTGENVADTASNRAVPCDEQITLKSIREISHDIRPVTTGALPEECVMNTTPYDGRHFTQSCVHWKASAVCTKAAYFEDVQLERYGHTIVRPALQPIVSGAKFFAAVPLLPYKMGVTPPNECVYTLGHYRTGNRSPYMVQPIPISARGALFQAGAIVGGAAVIP